MSETKLSQIYYSPNGYRKGLAAIKKLAEAAKVSEEVVQVWLRKQAAWQVYLPASQHIQGPKFDVSTPNKVHQADLLFCPTTPWGGGGDEKTFNFVLTVVDMASRYKEAELLTSEETVEVAGAFQRIYSCGPLRWPQLLQVDPGHESMCSVSKVMKENGVNTRRGRVDIHRDQGIVEHFNRTLAKRLFSHQYAIEMRLTEGQRSTTWVARLRAVVSALNNEVTRLTGKKPAEAIIEKAVPSVSSPYSRPVGLNEKNYPLS